MFFDGGFPGVALRFTPGFMLSAASRAAGFNGGSCRLLLPTIYDLRSQQSRR
jgi:hypothetical protein